jgi:hypothetical protein
MKACKDCKDDRRLAFDAHVLETTKVPVHVHLFSERPGSPPSTSHQNGPFIFASGGDPPDDTFGVGLIQIELNYCGELPDDAAAKCKSWDATSGLIHELHHAVQYILQGSRRSRLVAVETEAPQVENIYRRCADRCQRDYNGYLKLPTPPRCDCDPSGINGDGLCQPRLGSTPTCCNKQCIDVQTDNANCGWCGNVCEGAANTCTAGSCQCPPGTDFQSDPNNCGGCGVKCPQAGDGAPMPCVGGQCTCQEQCGGCSGYQCNGVCDYCNDPGVPIGKGNYRCCWCGGDGCL